MFRGLDRLAAADQQRRDLRRVADPRRRRAAFPLATIEAFKYYEIQKYLSLTDHLFTTYTPLANADAMQSLPKDLRGIVERNMNAAGLRQRSDIVGLETALESKLQTQGFTVATGPTRGRSAPRFAAPACMRSGAINSAPTRGRCWKRPSGPSVSVYRRPSATRRTPPRAR